ncbi:MAG: hypothetical protein ACRD0U_02245 [Acidimicrobiales bacterium]
MRTVAAVSTSLDAPVGPEATTEFVDIIGDISVDVEAGGPQRHHRLRGWGHSQSSGTRSPPHLPATCSRPETPPARRPQSGNGRERKGTPTDESGARTTSLLRACHEGSREERQIGYLCLDPRRWFRLVVLASGHS